MHVPQAARQMRVVDRGGYARKAPIDEMLAATLERYLREGRPHLAKHEVSAFFLSAKSTPYSEGSPTEMLQRLSQRVGFRVTAHMLRHACAVHMLEAGADIHDVGRLLGHRHRKSTTAAYADMATAVLSRKKRSVIWERPLTHFSSLVDGTDEDWSAILEG